MKNKLLMLLLIFISLYCYAADSLKNQFDMLFVKSGVTSINITDLSNSPTSVIDFSLWNSDVINSSMPTAEFKVNWKISRGNSYSLKLSFNSEIGLTGQSMMISENGDPLNYYAEATINGDTKTNYNSSDENDWSNSNNSSIIATEHDLVLIDNTTRAPYTMIDGEATVNLTLIPERDGEVKYFKEGNYSGYVVLTLTTEGDASESTR